MASGGAAARLGAPATPPRTKLETHLINRAQARLRVRAAARGPFRGGRSGPPAGGGRDGVVRHRDAATRSAVPTARDATRGLTAHNHLRARSPPCHGLPDAHHAMVCATLARLQNDGDGAEDEARDPEGQVRRRPDAHVAASARARARARVFVCVRARARLEARALVLVFLICVSACARVRAGACKCVQVRASACKWCLLVCACMRRRAREGKCAQVRACVRACVRLRACARACVLGMRV